MEVCRVTHKDCDYTAVDLLFSWPIQYSSKMTFLIELQVSHNLWVTLYTNDNCKLKMKLKIR